MNFLKKASLLTSLMLGMLLFSAHTTDNISDTITDDFTIVLDAGVKTLDDGDQFYSEYRCDDQLSILVGHQAGPAALASYIRIVVTGANQTLEVRNVTNPYMYLGIDRYNFSFHDLYDRLPPGTHEITFRVWIYNSNGSQMLSDSKYVKSSCGSSGNNEPVEY